MKIIKTLGFSVLVMMAVCGGVVQAAGTDQWPTKPIELWIGWAPGGAVDLAVRAYQPAFSKALGVPVVINYKPGGTGTLCAEYIARAKPDGYTIQESSYGIISNQLITMNTLLTFNDFTYIVGHSGFNYAIVVKQDAPWRTFKEWVEYARKKPGSTYGVPGAYTILHVIMEWIIKHEGLQGVNMVPFQGGGELIAPVLGGHIDLAAAGGQQIPLCEAGKLRTLLQWSGEVPDPTKVPYLTEVYPDLPDALRAIVDTPSGLSGPKGIPAPIVQKLVGALKKAVNDEAYIKFLKQYKRQLVIWEGDEAFKKVKIATEAYAAVIKEMGFEKK